MKSVFGKSPGSRVGEVVAMDRFRSGRSLSPIRQAEGYWTALLDGDGVPKRSRVDPRGLENILEYTFILERIAPGIARFRLAGHHLSALAGMEVRGMTLSAMFEASARKEVSQTIERVFSEPAIAEVELSASGGLGCPRLEGRMILLPLRSDLGEVSRILGVLVSDDPVGTTPRQFEICANQVREVAGIQGPNTADKEPAMEFAEDQQEFDHPAQHLRLVVSNEPD